jgi:uncharacterized RDD family membrane protein YckC
MPIEDGTNVESDSRRPPVARLLSAGAKSAERVAHAAGVDHALDEAVEEAIVRALRSPAIGRAIERAIENHAANVGLNNDEIAEVVKRALKSEAVEQAWGEVLASDEIQTLIERIVGGPELRSALRAQSAGLITDIGARLTTLTEKVDDTLERIVRRKDQEELETNQAGLVTRLVAAGIDLGLLFVLYSIASSVFASVISYASGGRLSLAGVIVLSTLGFFIACGIFVTFWALAGQTPGMRILSIRLVHEGSPHITFRVATRRVFALIVALLPLGIGYFAIARDPSRRGWHDRMVKTEVIYDDLDVAPRYTPRAASSGSARARGRSKEGAATALSAPDAARAPAPGGAADAPAAAGSAHAASAD